MICSTASPIAVSGGALEIGGNTVWSEWFAGRLDDLRVGAFDDRIAAGLALGRHAAVVTELDRLIGANPYRENLH